jgi:hypothetical protein
MQLFGGKWEKKIYFVREKFFFIFYIEFLKFLCKVFDGKERFEILNPDDLAELIHIPWQNNIILLNFKNDKSFPPANCVQCTLIFLVLKPQYFRHMSIHSTIRSRRGKTHLNWENFVSTLIMTRKLFNWSKK